MAVHRITDAAEVALQEIARREGKKPSAVLSDLAVDYLAGLDFAPSEERRRRAAGPSKVLWPMPDPLAKYKR